MQLAEWAVSNSTVPEPPEPETHDDSWPVEPWLPARDVTLVTIAAYALIALAALTEMFQ